jgi:hypothetical protein
MFQHQSSVLHLDQNVSSSDKNVFDGHTSFSLFRYPKWNRIYKCNNFYYTVVTALLDLKYCYQSDSVISLGSLDNVIADLMILVSINPKVINIKGFQCT